MGPMVAEGETGCVATVAVLGEVWSLIVGDGSTAVEVEVEVEVGALRLPVDGVEGVAAELSSSRSATFVTPQTMRPATSAPAVSPSREKKRRSATSRG
jgi:hypothetical protein